MPGKTGPTTENGKTKISTNRTGHGLRSIGLIKCKKEKCFYYSICTVPEAFPEKWEIQVYGMPCLSESKYAQDWRISDYRPDYFDKDNKTEVKILEDLISSSILKDRAEKAVGMFFNGDLVQAQLALIDPAKCQQYPELKKLYGYYKRAKGLWWKAVKAASPYIRGILAVEKYKRECDEFMRKRESRSQ